MTWTTVGTGDGIVFPRKKEYVPREYYDQVLNDKIKLQKENSILQSKIDKIVMTSIKQIVDKELDRANGMFPSFSSTHEGFSVIEEEWQEVAEDLEEFAIKKCELWKMIREQCYMTESKDMKADSMYRSAIKVIEEGIQLAAMCLKFRCIDIKEKNND